MEKKERMFSLVEQWRTSGLTRKKFATQHSVSEKSFAYWSTKQFNEVEKPKQKTTRVTQPSFIELSSEKELASEVPELHVALEFAHGLCIKIYR
ncbi:MAG: hypothetical protein WCN92_10715 [Eubacteriales bacterium]